MPDTKAPNRNEDTLNQKTSQFVNSSTLPGAMFYAGKENTIRYGKSSSLEICYNC